MSGGGAEDEVKGGQLVVGEVQNGFGGDADDGFGGEAGGGGGGDGQDGYREILIRWVDNVACVTLGTDPNDPLEYDLGLELHQPIMSTLGEPGKRLETDRGFLLCKKRIILPIMCLFLTNSVWFIMCNSQCTNIGS